MGFGFGQAMLLEGNRDAGDDGRKRYLRRCAEPPGELSLATYPIMKALQRLERLSRNSGEREGLPVANSESCIYFLVLQF
jgi:hypothetical protein